MKKYIKIIVISSAALIGFTAKGKELFAQNETMETGSIKELTTSPIPAETGTKYRISFSASTTGKHTVEKIPRIRIMNHRHAANRVRVSFYNKEKKRISGYKDVFILSQKPNTYELIFYPPRNASSMRIFAQPAKNSIVNIKNISLENNLSGEKNQYLNTHSRFDMGDLNLYGCTSGFGGRFYTRPDGKTVWKTGFLAHYPSFPVQGGKYYDFYCRGKKYRRKAWIWVNCYDGIKRRPIKQMKIKLSQKGAKTRLMLPPTTVAASLDCYCVILEEFRANKSENQN